MHRANLPLKLSDERGDGFRAATIGDGNVDVFSGKESGQSSADIARAND